MLENKLKLAFIVNLYPPYIVGGNEILARDVITALRERGHEVHVLTGRGAQLPADGFTHAALDLELDRKEDIFLGGLPLTGKRLVAWHLYNPRTYEGVRATLAELQPDLVIAWNLYMASMAPLVAARRSGFPVVAQPADKWLLYGLKDLSKLVPASRPWHRWLLAAIRSVVQPVLNSQAKPHYILAVSEFIRRLHLEAGYRAAQSIATYLGVPVDLFPAVERLAAMERPWRLMFAGQLWAGKGPQVAVEAMRLLQSRRNLPPITLDIYGGGVQHFVDSLNRQIHEAGLVETVAVRGFVSRQQLAAEFARHDAYLFCSTWDEPFSGGLLEAMSTGLPVIATTAGGTPEGVQEGINGLLTPPGDAAALAAAIARLVLEPGLARRIGQQAAADVRARWSFDHYIDRLERVYRAIVAGHKPDRPITLSPRLADPTQPTDSPT